MISLRLLLHNRHRPLVIPAHPSTLPTRHHRLIVRQTAEAPLPLRRFILYCAVVDHAQVQFLEGVAAHVRRTAFCFWSELPADGEVDA